ncbi:MAG: pyridoxal phosphate-dependent aminotransferase [Candidatus Thermoplasmatota archaeon]|nr:pyridoxal phosphate-dependent aminotransferase [Candidatus Thermoplasmatota archaeon]
MSIFDVLKELKASEIRRMFELAAKREDSISLGIGEPDFPTPKDIKERVKKALDADATHYAPNAGIPELREAIAEKSRRENGIDCTADEVLVTIGATEGLFLALASILKEGDEVLVPAPAFLTYNASISLAGGKSIEVPCMEKNNFHINAKDIEQSINNRTRAIIIASPNNPTGAALSKEELKSIAELAIEKDLFIITDEVYERFMYDGRKSFSIASMPEARDKTITINSFSKTYAMTGWRIGYAIAPEEVFSKMLKLHMYIASCINTFSQYGALEALRGGYESVDKMIAEYARRRSYVYDRLSAMKHVRVTKPEGAFYFFPNIEDTNLSSADFCDKLFDETGVVVVNGEAFGECGSGHVRISYATSMEKLEKAMDRMESFLEKI